MDLLYTDVIDLIIREIINSCDAKNIYHASLINKMFYTMINKYEREISMITLYDFYKYYTKNFTKPKMTIACNTDYICCRPECYIYIEILNLFEDYAIIINSSSYCNLFQETTDLSIGYYPNKTFNSNKNSVNDADTFLKKYDKWMQKNIVFIDKEDIGIYTNFIGILKRFFYFYNPNYIYVR